MSLLQFNFFSLSDRGGEFNRRHAPKVYRKSGSPRPPSETENLTASFKRCKFLSAPLEIPVAVSPAKRGIERLQTERGIISGR